MKKSFKNNNNKTEKVELDIQGMNCTGCANNIKKNISRLEGVKSIDVNFTSEIAVLEYDKNTISLVEIAGGIRKLGFDVSEDEEMNSNEQKKQNLKHQRVKIYISILLSLIIFFISLNMHKKDLPSGGFHNIANLSTLFILTTIVIFWSGNKFLLGAYNALKNRTADMNTLISIGVMASYLFSIVISINQIFNLNIKALALSNEVYFETSAMIISFILIGNYLETVLKSKTQTSIRKLKNLQAKNVTVIRNKQEIQIPYKKVRQNDIVIIRAGDKVPVDGTIIEGNGTLDESAMTGESIPSYKNEGDKLVSGTILTNGFVKLKAEKVGKETMLSKIISLVNEASNSKPKIQRLADKISAVFVPIVVVISILTFIIWYIILGKSFDTALLYTVSVLIVACPCALGLASPMAVVIGVGRAAENGILFNNVEAIEKLNKIDTICFDKTGTLTSGELSVRNIQLLNNIDENKLLYYIYSLEKYSNHPIALSVTKYCIKRSIKSSENIQNYNLENGKGLSAVIDGKKISAGNIEFIKENDIQIPDNLNPDKSHLYVTVDGYLGGVIEFEDKLKPESNETIKILRQRGYDLFLISGDNENITKKIADELSIEKYSHNTFPDKKEEIISSLQKKNKNVAMIGDGINDAPSLARANVGIATGTGQDIAIDSADVILVKGDLSKIQKLFKISERTVSIIKQNFFWAFFYNILAIPLAAGVLSPYGIYITPVMAAMLMAFSDVITVIGNSLRLKYIKI